MRPADSSGMYQAYMNWYEQAKTSWEIGIELELTPSNIIYSGMGGSGASGDLIADWVWNRIEAPFFVLKGYHLPKWAGEETLLISVSVSGNTEETLSAFYEGVKKGCKVVVISSDGMLERVSRRASSFIKIPKPLAPRVGLPYMLYASLKLLESIGLVDDREIEDSIKVLKELKPKLSLDSKDNPAKHLADEIHFAVPIIYAPPLMAGVSYRFKASLAENAKMDSIVNVAPELCHNEIVAWERMNVDNYRVVLLRYEGEEPEIRERMEAIKEIVEESGQEPIEVRANAGDRLSKIVQNLYVCEMATYYSSLLRGVDPLSTRSIDRLKATLKRRLEYIHRYTELEDWATS